MNKKMVGVLVLAVLATVAVIALISAQIKKDAAAPQTTADATAPADAASVEPAAATPDKTPSVDDPIVAKVDGSNVLRSDVMEFMENLPPQMKQLPAETLFPMVLEQVINGKIVEEKADKTDVSNDPEVAKRLAEAKEQITRAVYVEKEIEKNLSADRVQKAYDKFVAEQGNVEEVRARHILVPTEAEAKDIIKKLDGGAKFEDLAKELSKDDSNKASGGDLGYFTKDTMVKEFADAAFSMKKGDVTQTPVKTQFGYHVIQVEDKRNRPVPQMAEIKPMLEAQERREILAELLKDWRQGATVETFDMNGKPVAKEATPAPAEAPAATPSPAPAPAEQPAQ